MCKKNVFECAFYFLEEVLENNVVESWINDVAFIVRFNVVRRDGQVMNLELGNIDSLFLLFSNNTNFCVHLKVLKILYIRKIFDFVYYKEK